MGRIDKKRGGDEGEEREKKEEKGKTESKVESLGGERNWNIGSGESIEEVFKRKREKEEEGKEDEKQRFIKRVTSR